MKVFEIRNRALKGVRVLGKLQVTRMDINYTARASESFIEYYTDEIKEGGMSELCSARRTRNS
jgi:hypothetical protein